MCRLWTAIKTATTDIGKDGWAIILQFGASVVYTAFLGWLIYILSRHTELPATIPEILANFGYGFLLLLSIPTVSYGIGSWLGKVKVSGGRDGISIEAEGDEK